MSEKKAKYITTTLPYVNADPHIGFALEMVQADTLARYWRLMGEDVFFSTGTDEHGQKIAEKADSEGKDRQVYVDHFAAQFGVLKDSLNLSYDNFIRTTDTHHMAAAQEIWKRCEAVGDIYKKTYKGLYCVGDEMYMKESELVDGKCPNHPNMELQEVEEENYFFKLSNYQQYLEEYLAPKGVVVPEWRRKEALAFVQDGLEDFSISRQKNRMDWGVPVPGDDDHVMYVWFDALTNYISTLGWPEDDDGTFSKYWTEGQTLQFAGKDQVRFQSIMWQAMLKSANIKATDQVFYHGFINSGGQKMSKSLGNVIAPADMVARYGTDAVRYMLLRHTHPTDDSDITWEKMDEWYTANLVNGLGNLTARIMKMAQTHVTAEAIQAYRASKDVNDFDELTNGNPAQVPDLTHFTKCVESYNFQEAADNIWRFIGDLDQVIQDTQPFKLIKTDEKKAKEILLALVDELYDVAIRLEPFMPAAARTIKQAVSANKKPENLFNRLDS